MAECEESEHLFAYLVDPLSAEGLRFAAHADDCVGCKTRYRRVRAIEEGLSLGSTTDREDLHPNPEDLLAFHRGRSASSVRASEVDAHLQECAFCRSELAALATFDFSAAGAASEVSTAEGEFGRADRAGSATLPGPVTRLLAWLKVDVEFGPAVAFAALVLLSIPVIAYVANLDQSGTEDVESVASVEPSENSDERPIIPRRSPEETDEPPQLAPESAPTPSRLAEAEPETEPRSGGEVEALPVEESLEPEQEVVLLASLDQWSPPGYNAPAGAPGYTRSPIVVRAGNGDDELPTPRVVAPDHVAHTIAASPTLYWLVERGADTTAEITLTREDTGEVLLEFEVPPPVASGFHGVRLEELGVRLDTGVDYRLYVSIVSDPLRRSRDRRDLGAFRRIDAPADLESDLERLESAGHAYAKHGLWFDAVAFFMQLAETSPEDPSARTLRDSLLRQAGLPTP